MLQDVTIESLMAHYAAVRQRLGYSSARPVLRLVSSAPVERGRRIYVEPIGPENDVLWTRARKIVSAYGAPIMPASRRVKAEIARFWNVSVADMEGESRVRKVILPRQECMYVLHDIFGLSWCETGRRLGGRDHTTALHGTISFRCRLARGERAWSTSAEGRAWLEANRS